MSLDEFRLTVDESVQLYQRLEGTRVGRDAQLYLVEHAAPQIDEIDRRLNTGELTRDALRAGIIELLKIADDERPPSFIRPPGIEDGRFSREIPEVAPLTQEDVINVMDFKCPVFPYCSDASRCPH